ncbi:hypothetical protein BKA67DRAFT_531287 [Truncatella angustata]|uniref:Rhodopsin domain-containing protein n=1 Tax=Truncatella angustata TaxID=152316 RepID=A0A9P8V081_9PEZI|nr:uncharacterized protein BKA67DRAFT_531287 [Truncatella angustata]KAH6661221.1 hypothetical protein BKA67DRAFT_531287 [Truncatella angustata]KAH8194168.1 hypothetical protein TruAng_011669 [Truncatella angustata]
MTSLLRRDDDDDDTVFTYVNPWVELNAGLWSLFAGATILLALRLWCKVARRHGLWYDDYVLVAAWSVLTANNILIVYEFATGYILENSTKKWDDRMHILINISSCGTLIGQALSKTAFAVTLLRLSKRWQQWLLWFCIVTMNSYMVAKVILQWAKICGKASYDVWYRLDICLDSEFRDGFKEGGNVYNIIMDFIFACLPWLIVRHLEMRKIEKIGLCITLSLGMVVAIVAAVRVSWKDDGNTRDPYYIYRNAVSQVWYSSEITGTIMVQCIPILRTMIKEIQTSLTSRKLGSHSEGPSTLLGSSKRNSKRASAGIKMELVRKGSERVVLKEIPEEPKGTWEAPTSWKKMGTGESLSSLDEERAMPISPRSERWMRRESENSVGYAPRMGQSLESDSDGLHSFTGIAIEQNDGLSPPPQRKQDSVNWPLG